MDEKIEIKGSKRDLKVSVMKNGFLRPISRWVFFPPFGVCFKLNGNGWEEVEYEDAIGICERVILNSQKDPNINVKGSMLRELRVNVKKSRRAEILDEKLSTLMSGEKVVIGGLEW